jgi:catechol-2,3-dioxygenase
MAQVQSLNHTAICVHDLDAAEEFYCGMLGARVASATNFATDDVLKGRSVHKSIILADYLIALMLARDFMPMPPVDNPRGAHGFRHAFAVSRDSFADLMVTLKDRDLQFEGPVEHPEQGPFGESIYMQDPSGNFLEILWRRDEDVTYDAVQGIGEG